MLNNKKSEFKTSKFQDWGTPWDLFNNLDAEFKFTIDVCASSFNTKCKRYYDITQDGLKQDWTGEIVWCNPVFSQEEIVKWLKKAKESKCLSVFLLPARTESSWFYEYALKGEIRFIYRPIRFLMADGEPSPGRGLFGSMIVILRNMNGISGSANYDRYPQRSAKSLFLESEIRTKMPPRTRAFIVRVKAWCNQQYGRRAELARFLGVPRQTVTDMLNGRQNPTSEQLLAIQEYLAKHP